MKKHKLQKNQPRMTLTELLSPKEPLKKEIKSKEKVESQVKEIHNTNIVRTTVHLPESTHLKMKLYCIEHGLSIKDFVTETLITALKSN